MEQNNKQKSAPEYPQTDRADTGKLTIWERMKGKWALRLLIGAVAGAFAGFLYWEFIGCNGGTCPITASPERTVLVFTFLGAMMARR
jgi:hypothetical protein